MRAHAGLMLLVAGTGAVASLASVSCVDEVHSEDVAALGPEVSGVPPGLCIDPGNPASRATGAPVRPSSSSAWAARST